MRVIPIVVLGPSTVNPPEIHPVPFSVERFHNRKRLLICFDGSSKDPRAGAQTKNLAPAELKDYDLVVVEAYGDGSKGRFKVLQNELERRRLYRRFAIHDNNFHVVLIGKDGHIAGSWDRPISKKALFGLIDAMPMRKNEVRSRKSG